MASTIDRQSRRLFSVVAAAAVASTCGAAEYVAKSAKQVKALRSQLQPGDVVVMADGVWKNQRVVLKGQGTAERPITLCAQTPGQVVLTGTSSLKIEGQHLVVSGIYFKNGKLPQKLFQVRKRDGKRPADVLEIRGQNCRVTDSAVVNYQCVSFVHMTGGPHRLDHCYFSDKKKSFSTLEIRPARGPDYNQVDHNHFGRRAKESFALEAETIRIEPPSKAKHASPTLVEQNLFEHCSADSRVIADLASGNVYRYNTFFECAGMLSLAGSHDGRVDGNYFIGNHKEWTGGVAISGGNQVVVNNYLEGLKWNPAFEVRRGYFAGPNCLIAFNTVVDSSEFIDAGPDEPDAAGLLTDEEREMLPEELPPDDVTVANNIIANGAVLSGETGERWGWKGNLTTSDFPRNGVHVVDPMLERGEDGVWRPRYGSPARGGARGEYPQAQFDIDGHRRLVPCDVGCDQLPDTSPRSRPLTAADVGPSWMEPTARIAAKPTRGR